MTAPVLYPVAEMPDFAGGCPYPWVVAGDWAAFERRRLTVGMTDAEVGSVAAALAEGAGIDPGPGAAATLEALAAGDYLGLRGGLTAAAGDRVIGPACCTGLGEWREWLAGLDTGRSPWMGHDPAAWVEWGAETVRVWSDGGFKSQPAPAAFAIDFTRGDVAAQLDRVAAELTGFAGRLAGWAAGQGPADAGRLAGLFWHWFGPVAPPAPPDPPD